jgi:hypothetical protein
MKVTVIDRMAMREAWGNGGYYLMTREIEISDNCPTCGSKRGIPRSHQTYEDGDVAWSHVWDNPCGHIDFYSSVIMEADEIKEAMEHENN